MSTEFQLIIDKLQLIAIDWRKEKPVQQLVSSVTVISITLRCFEGTIELDVDGRRERLTSITSDFT